MACWYWQLDVRMKAVMNAFDERAVTLTGLTASVIDQLSTRSVMENLISIQETDH
ncbi:MULTISPECIES: hypothetical protein [Acinetobacter]|jgi:hypothetical protein|uniref:hypothetical protein n=1 Tax=Acinetobacter TaxID=469 RepID=UPI0001BBA776|nr:MULTISPECIES: hypothetical protein [Acinetobacter]EEY91334.1 hypothetical protein HMPREF0017_00347 [Acinetobacter lwoffii SH145]QXB41547.1 hypothetical protein I6L23_05890 [Acinetobacter lwoffii]